MSENERFPDEVLQQALEAAMPFEWLGGVNHYTLNVADLAAMRAILEGHLAEQPADYPTQVWCRRCGLQQSIPASDGSPR